MHPPATSQVPRRIALVMPVYNEEGCIAEVVDDWRRTLERADPNFLMIVLNDGSRDRTVEKLAPFASDPKISVIHKPNSGHGPTLLMGYHQAVGLAEWVFQVDSDNELPSDRFPEFWRRRDEADFVFGVRTRRQQTAGRRIISMVSRLTIRLLFKPGVRDVNAPYRLMRAEPLARVLGMIPDNTFAPNIVIAGLSAKFGYRILNLEVPHSSRRTGAVSLLRWKLWKSAIRAFCQTLVIAFKRG